jgi:hypothetical protein
MEKTEIKMHQNLYKNTGKTLGQWVFIVKQKNIGNRDLVLKYLKERHGFSHGLADLVAVKALGPDPGSV